MKTKSVIKYNGYILEHQDDKNISGTGLYTISKWGSHQRNARYTCSFSQALEFLAARFIASDLPIDEKLVAIESKMMDILDLMPAEWRNKWNPKYKLTTWH